MTTAYLIGDLELEEGRVLSAYPDVRSPLAAACAKAGISHLNYENLPGWRKLSGAPWTIGDGHTGPEVCPGLIWTEAQARQALIADSGQVIQRISLNLPWWRSLDDVRQDVLVRVGFNVGVHGLLEFHHMLAALQAGDYAKAAAELMDSAAARELPARYDRLAGELKTGMRGARMSHAAIAASVQPREETKMTDATSISAAAQTFAPTPPAAPAAPAPTKSPLQSTTIQGAMLSIASSLIPTFAKMLGLDVSAAETAEVIGAAGTIVGFAMTIVGRMKAKHTIA